MAGTDRLGPAGRDFFEIFCESSDDDANWKTLEYESLLDIFDVLSSLLILRDSRFTVYIKVLKLNSITLFENFRSELKTEL